MKIKRFNNIFIMGLLLSGAMLIGVYALKIFFPEIVVGVAEIEAICMFGKFIDENEWAWYIATAILSFITCYFYCCACCSKKHLGVIGLFLVCCTVAGLLLAQKFLPQYYTTINYISMIFLPFLLCGKMTNTAICFTTINLLQMFTLEIRSIGLMIIEHNFATFTILMIDVYILEFLLYFAFNMKNKTEVK